MTKAVKAHIMKSPEVWANMRWGDRAIASAHGFLCLLMSVVYLAAPAPLDREAVTIDAVWVSIAVLSAMAVWRFKITHQRPLSRRMAYALAAAAFGMLYALVWSYQNRYDLEPTLILKAPTLVFIFVFLALETLRGDRLHLLAIGMTALAGWVCLAGFAIWDAGPASITRDYLQFLTGDQILIGAVIEMGLAIGFTTCALTLAVHRGRRLLERSIAANAMMENALKESRTLSEKLEVEVDERRKANDALEQLAYNDPLTGLPNMRQFRRMAAKAAADVADGASDGFSILLLDLDHFRLFNDGFGREAGNAALLGAAKLLEAHTPEGAQIARLGADEFALLTPAATTREDAKALADKLGDLFGKPFSAGDREFGAGVTIGAAVHAPGDRGGCVIAYADMALNLAKQKGRRSILVHDPATKSQSQDRLDLEADLRQAIVNHELELFYQPIYETRGGALAGWEALARWPRADGGMTSPVEFIPIAEETGSIVQLGAWALTEAAKAACAFREAGAPEGAFMSVNVSPRQLLDAEGLIEAVDAALKIYPHIKLEVTESGIVDDPARAAEVLGDLRARGASLALDDFGTGASSLAMVGQFPFNTLKIDRSFVIDRSAHASAFLQCIVGLARALDLDTVAEGVSNDEDSAALSLLGASYVQGFGLARPAPRDVILSGFAQNTEPRAANAS